MRRTVRSGKKKWWNTIFVLALAVVVAGGCLHSGWFRTAYAVTAEEEEVIPEDPTDEPEDAYGGTDMAKVSESVDAAGSPEGTDGTVFSAGSELGDAGNAGASVDRTDAFSESSSGEALGAPDSVGTADPFAESAAGEADTVVIADAPESAAENTTGAPEEKRSDLSEENGGIVTGEISFVPEADALADSDELFADYVDRLFYGDSGISTLANYGGTVLEGKALALYTTLRGRVEEVAAGTRASTIFALDPSDYTWTAEELGTDAADSDVLASLMTDEVYFLTAEAMSCLLVDCPWELFWYDKLSGVGISFSMRYTVNSDGALDTVELTQFVLAFYVAEDYQGSNNVTINTQKVLSVQSAAENAQSIAASYTSLSDREKMEAYRDEICALTSYNYDAINNPDVSYGDPWQLIYVFDGDESTTVVCEGYAKAFQYLCDMGLSEATSYLVTGTMSGGTGAGAHMWNVVHLNGANYLVDVTNCDYGTIGASGGLFLVNGESENCVDAEDPDEYDFRIGRATVKYLYDEHTTGLYSYDIRTLGTSHILKIDEEPAEMTELTYGYEGATLTIEAHTDEGEDVLYQWYQVEEDENGDIISYTKIEGATSSVLEIPEGLPAGTTVTFLCVVDHGTDELISHDAVVTIAAKELTESMVSLPEDTFDYTGEPITPEVLVSDLVNGVEMITPDDYELSYADNTEETTKAHVTVTGKGNYTGSVTLTFTIQGTASGAEEPGSGTGDSGDGSGDGSDSGSGTGSGSGSGSGSDSGNGSGSGSGSGTNNGSGSGSGSDSDNGSGSGSDSGTGSGSGSDSGSDSGNGSGSGSDSGTGNGSGSDSGDGSGGDSSSNGSDATGTSAAKTSDRGLVSPVRAGMAFILIADAALVMAVFRRKRPEERK